MGKERSRAEELMKAKSAMESTSARLTSELKVFTEKSEKVCVLFAPLLFLIMKTESPKTPFIVIYINTFELTLERYS